MIAPLADVAVMARALLAQTIGLTDGRVQINGKRIIARSGPSRPGSGQRRPAHPIQLPRVAPSETPQERAQRGWRLHHTAQHLLGLASAQRVGVVNAVTAGQRRCHQRQHLVSRVGTTWRISQVNVAVHQLSQPQMMGQGDGQKQPSIGHQSVIVEGNVDAVGALRW